MTEKRRSEKIIRRNEEYAFITGRLLSRDGSIQPGCEFCIIKDAGHWVMYERPEEFNSTLLELLASAEKR